MKLLMQRQGEADQNWSLLYIDGEFYCDVLEDEDRYLEAGGIKIPGRTAIPRGAYRLIIDFSNKFQKYMIHVIDVPQFSGVRIHGGVDEEDTEGCPIVGKRNGRVLVQGLRYSAGLKAKVALALDQGDDVVLEIV